MRSLWLCDASCLSLLWAQSLLLQRQTPRHDRERSHLASLGHKCEVNVSKHIKIYQDALTHPVLSQALTSSTLKSTLTKSQIFCVYIERSGKIDSKDFISTWDQHDLVRPRCRTQQILRRSQRGKHFVQTSRRSISMPTVLSKPENQMFTDFPSIHTAESFLSIAARCGCFWRCLDARNSKPGKPVSCLGWRFRDFSDFSA